MFLSPPIWSSVVPKTCTELAKHLTWKAHNGPWPHVCREGAPDWHKTPDPSSNQEQKGAVRPFTATPMGLPFLLLTAFHGGWSNNLYWLDSALTILLR